MGQIELMCETQGKPYPLQFQLLSKDVMGSQPPLLSGSDCVKLGLIEIKGSTSPLRQGDPQECARKSEVCYLNDPKVLSMGYRHRVALLLRVPCQFH